MTSPTLIEPARTRLLRGSLDRKLAQGADPHASRDLSRRADQLTSRRVRAGLAGRLRRIVAVAKAPARGVSTRVPLNRRGIVAEAQLILEVAAALDSADQLTAHGVALVERLLTDGGSPLFRVGSEGELRLELRYARAALHLV